MGDSGDEDLLGLFALTPGDQERTTMAVATVETGTPIGGRGGAAAETTAPTAPVDPSRRRRNAGGRSRDNSRPAGSSARPSTRGKGGGGEKIYRGRMDRNREQQQRQGQSSQLQQNQPSSPHRSGGATWAGIRRLSTEGADRIRKLKDVTSSITRKGSQESEHKGLGRLRHEARMRRDGNMAGDSGSRGESESVPSGARKGRESHDEPNGSRMSRESVIRGSNGNSGRTQLERQLSESTGHDDGTMKSKRHRRTQLAKQLSKSMGHALKDYDDGTVKSKGHHNTQLEKQLSKSMGHALKDNDDDIMKSKGHQQSQLPIETCSDHTSMVDASLHSQDIDSSNRPSKREDERKLQRRAFSRDDSMKGSQKADKPTRKTVPPSYGGNGINSSNRSSKREDERKHLFSWDDSMNDIQKADEPTRKTVPPSNRRNMMRSGSFDTSMRNLNYDEAIGEASSPKRGMLRRGSFDTSVRNLQAEAKSSSKRGMIRRGSFDTSMRNLQTEAKSASTATRRASRKPRRKSFDSSFNRDGSELPGGKISRRRSNSEGEDDPEEEEELARASNSPERRTSVDASLNQKESHDDPIESISIDEKSDNDGNSSRKISHESREGKDVVKRMSSRMSEIDASKRRNRRKSDYAKKMEARLASTANKKKRQSRAKTKSNRESQNTQQTGVTILSAEDNSVHSNEPKRTKDAHSTSVGDVQENDPREKEKKKYYLFSVTPFMLCAMCLCYVVSILIFCGLGFWAHKSYVAYDPEKDNPSTSNPGVDNNYEENDGNKDDVMVSEGTDNPGTTPSFQPSSYSINTSISLPTEMSDGSRSSLPTIAPAASSSAIPSFVMTATPSSLPSSNPSLLPTLSMRPSLEPSTIPSSSPTAVPGCPDQLVKSATLDDEGLLTLKYDVVVYQDDVTNRGGLLCASLEFTGGAAGWIGIAFSEATRNPTFGRKEAIIGIPGIHSSVAVDTSGNPGLGQQNFEVEVGPKFANPGKYNIPAGGVGNNGYSGPSLMVLANVDKQTLINGSISVIDHYASMGIISDQRALHTQMSFVKYLQEPGEIEIDPHGSTLLLYAVAAPSDSGSEYDAIPEWKSTYLIFMGSSTQVKSSGLVRKRKRQHEHRRNI